MNGFEDRWDRQDMLEALDEFKKLYEARPIKDNHGGMKSAHMFPAWYIVRTLKPKFLIESGVWKGLGTWFFEQASPDTQIISIDPNPHFRVYNSPNVKYQTRDFLETDWSHLPKDETLCFFDDHQNFLERLKRCQELGFKRVMTEDNYPWQQGDCYTPKKILANRSYVIDEAGQRTWHDPIQANYDWFQEHVGVYQEMPPLFKGKYNRWGEAWDEEYPTPDALLQEEQKDQYELFYNEQMDYTWICYLELK